MEYNLGFDIYEVETDKVKVSDAVVFSQESFKWIIDAILEGLWNSDDSEAQKWILNYLVDLFFKTGINIDIVVRMILWELTQEEMDEYTWEQQFVYCMQKYIDYYCRENHSENYGSRYGIEITQINSEERPQEN